MADAKNATWEWNFGRSPQYAYQQKMRTAGGTIEVMMDVQQGIIRDVRFFGDFFSKQDPEVFAQALIGQPHSKAILESILEAIDISQYFNNVSKKELLAILSA